MAKRKISARRVIEDLRAGLSNDELMEKHNMSPESLRYVFKRLVEAGLMTELQYYGWISRKATCRELFLTRLTRF